MGAPLKWFPFFIDDWETDEKIRGLSLEEQGAYLRMLCWQWREGSLSGRPADVERKLGVRKAIAQRLLRLFFIKDGAGSGRVVNKKLAELYAAQIDKSDKARRAALQSHRSRSANAERSLDGRTADGEGSRSRIRSEIKTSLSAHAEQHKAPA